MCSGKKLFRIGWLLICCALISYPFRADREYQKQVLALAESMSKEQEMGSLPEHDICRAYNEGLTEQTGVPFGARIFSEEEYRSLPGGTEDETKAIAILRIPRLNRVLPVYRFAGEDELEKGIGHLPQSSFPCGGPGTHTVLAGHSGQSGKALFSGLSRLEIGDCFSLTVFGETLIYRVVGRNTVLPDETDALAIQAGKDLCTLITCVPEGINSHRLLVTGERIEQ